MANTPLIGGVHEIWTKFLGQGNGSFGWNSCWEGICLLFGPYAAHPLIITVNKKKNQNKSLKQNLSIFKHWNVHYGVFLGVWI